MSFIRKALSAPDPESERVRRATWTGGEFADVASRRISLRDREQVDGTSNPQGDQSWRVEPSFHLLHP